MEKCDSEYDSNIPASSAMKVLNICQDDWANFAYSNAMALRSVGVNTRCVTRNKHTSEYINHGDVMPSISDICTEIKKADVVQFFHDNTNLFRMLIPAMAGKKIIVYHTSSFYRKNHAHVNAIMNPCVHKSVCAMPEFMGKGSKNEVYMVGAVDASDLHPKRQPRRPYKVGHYPSNPSIKGSVSVIEMVGSVLGNGPHKLHYSDTQVSHTEQRRRMAECDIYVELFSMRDANAMPYGNFGITALEAAALGKVVVTNCLGLEIYEKHYGPIGLCVANDEITFKENLARLLTMRPYELLAEQQLSYEWVRKNHGYQASGEYILKNIMQ